MSKPTTISVEAAQKQLHEARALYQELDSRLESGEPGVTLTQWADEKLKVQFLERQLAGAKAAAGRAEDERLRAEAAALRKKSRDKLAKLTSDVVASFDEAVQAVNRLVECVKAHNDFNGEVKSLAEQLRPSDSSVNAPLPPWLKVVTDSTTTFATVDIAAAALLEALQNLKGGLAADHDLTRAPGTVRALHYTLHEVARVRERAERLSKQEASGS